MTGPVINYNIQETALYKAEIFPYRAIARPESE